jgi:hypothetical protein
MNINLVGGDPYGGSCTIDQFFLWRPFKPQSATARAGQGGSIHIGASTHPGPGLGGGSGYLAAKGWAHERAEPGEHPQPGPRLARSGCRIRALSDEPHHGALQRLAARGNGRSLA